VTAGKRHRYCGDDGIVDKHKYSYCEARQGRGVIVDNLLNTFMDEFQKNIPPALSELKDVFSAHVRATAETIIAKMDLVSREEFDTQRLLLRRAQEKVDALAQRLEQLESKKKSTKKT
jgi:BMFP domain-containing protein YqiC